MDRIKAQAILGLLAKGMCPSTGEMLGDASPLAPEVIEALNFAINQLDAPAREERRATLPQKAGATWPPEEDRDLLRRFDAGMKPAALAQLHGRTRGAIESRLMKHGRMASSHSTRH
jgi:hypothetical protein